MVRPWQNVYMLGRMTSSSYVHVCVRVCVQQTENKYLLGVLNTRRNFSQFLEICTHHRNS